MKKLQIARKVVQIPPYSINLEVIIGYDLDQIGDYITNKYPREDFREVFEDCDGITFAEPGRIIVVFNLNSKPNVEIIVHESAHVVSKLFKMLGENVRPNHIFIYHLEFICKSILAFFKEKEIIETKYNY